MAPRVRQLDFKSYDTAEMQASADTAHGTFAGKILRTASRAQLLLYLSDISNAFATTFPTLQRDPSPLAELSNLKGVLNSARDIVKDMKTTCQIWKEAASFLRWLQLTTSCESLFVGIGMGITDPKKFEGAPPRTSCFLDQSC